MLEAMATAQRPDSVLDLHKVSTWLAALRSLDWMMGHRLEYMVLRKAAGFELSTTVVEDISVSQLARARFVFSNKELQNYYFAISPVLGGKCREIETFLELRDALMGVNVASVSVLDSTESFPNTVHADLEARATRPEITPTQTKLCIRAGAAASKAAKDRQRR